MNYFETQKEIKNHKFLELQSKFFCEIDNFFEHALFHDYLMSIHWEDYTWRDDDMPDAFQDWQADMDRSEMLQHFTDFISQ